MVLAAPHLPSLWLSGVTQRRAVMALAIRNSGLFPKIVGVFEHTMFVVLGVIFMIVGLGLSVTMVMLPVGVVVGLIGVAMFVGGLFAHIDGRT
jgi:hypothetical protein